MLQNGLEFIQIQTTTDNSQLAKEIAKELIALKLVVCVQIIPNVTSLYTWENKLEESGEFLLFMKTKSSNFEQIAEKIKQLHTYETPEIIATTITNISNDYAKWMKLELI